MSCKDFTLGYVTEPLRLDQVNTVGIELYLNLETRNQNSPNVAALLFDSLTVKWPVGSFSPISSISTKPLFFPDSVSRWGEGEGVRSGEPAADTLLPRLLCRDPVREPETDGDP